MADAAAPSGVKVPGSRLGQRPRARVVGPSAWLLRAGSAASPRLVCA